MNELVISKQVLPVIEIKDYDKIKAFCEEDVKKYKKYVVTKKTLEADIKKRAELNNIAKDFDEKRKAIEKIISKPIKDLKENVDALVTLYKEASSLLDTQIKAFEAQEDEEKKQDIQKIFDTKVQELKSVVKLDMIFDKRYLNKGFDLKDIEKDIETKLDKIRTELSAIENLKSEHELALKNMYLKDFNLGNVILENNRLNELKASTQKVEVAKEEIRQEKVEEMVTKPVETEEVDPIKTYTLKITGTLSQQKKLKEFLDLNKMTVERVE